MTDHTDHTDRDPRPRRPGRLRPLVGLLAVVVVGGTAVTWWLSPRGLTPAEAAVVGDWRTPAQPDGSSTVVALHPDRTCRVRWLDAGGGDDPGTPPQDGRWWIDRGAVVVDTRRTTGVVLDGTGPGVDRAGHVWTFAVADGGLVLGPESGRPVALQRIR